MASSSAPPHLLTLPREIRDQVYSYLCRPLELFAIDEIGGSTVIVALINAPYVSILSVHSRLRDEFTESACFTNLSATVLHMPGSGRWWTWSTEQDKVRRDNVALSRVRNISLWFFYSQSTPDDGLMSIIAALPAKMPCLHTLRVIEDNDFMDIAHMEFSNIIQEDGTIPKMPTKLIGLSLIQRVTGCKVRTVPALTSEEDDVQLFSRIKAVVYSSRYSCGSLWTPQAALRIEMPRRFKPCLQFLLAVHKVNGVRHTLKLIEWTEESCADTEGDV